MVKLSLPSDACASRKGSLPLHAASTLPEPSSMDNLPPSLEECQSPTARFFDEQQITLQSPSTAYFDPILRPAHMKLANTALPLPAVPQRGTWHCNSRLPRGTMSGNVSIAIRPPATGVVPLGVTTSRAAIAEDPESAKTCKTPAVQPDISDVSDVRRGKDNKHPCPIAVYVDLGCLREKVRTPS